MAVVDVMASMSCPSTSWPSTCRSCLLSDITRIQCYSGIRTSKIRIVNHMQMLQFPEFYTSISGLLAQILKHPDIEAFRNWSVRISKHPDIETSRYRSIRISKHPDIEASRYRSMRISKHPDIETKWHASKSGYLEIRLLLYSQKNCWWHWHNTFH